MYEWTKYDSSKLEIPRLDATKQIWYRQQDPMEALFTVVGTTDPGATDTILSVQIATSDPSSNLNITLDTIKDAVRELRFDHPGVAFQRAWRSGTPNPKDALLAYEVPASEADVDGWLSSVVFDRSDALESSNNDLDAAIQAISYELGKKPDIPYPVFTVRHVPATSPHGRHGLIFYLSHCIFDGIGSWQITDLFLAKLAVVLGKKTVGVREAISWGEEVKRLPIPFSAAVKVRWDAPKIPEDEVVIARTKEISTYVENMHALPILNPSAVGSVTGYINRTLPAEIVATLRKSARTHGCSIFSLLWAAMCITVLRVNPPSPSRLEQDISNPSVAVPSNLRHLIMDRPYDKTQWQTRLAMGEMPYVARNLGRFVRNDGDAETQEAGHQLMVQDIWTLAKEIAAQLEVNKKYSERTAVWIEELINFVVGLMMAAPASPMDPSAPATGLLNFSSIGVIDPYLAESHTISPGNDLIVSMPRMGTTCYNAFGGFLLTFHTYTWKGEMMMSYSFPEAASGTSQAQQQAWDEGKRAKNGDNSAVVVEFAEEFIEVLRIVAKESV